MLAEVEVRRRSEESRAKGASRLEGAFCTQAAPHSHGLLVPGELAALPIEAGSWALLGPPGLAASLGHGEWSGLLCAGKAVGP